jgi:hypothetical protein
MSLAQQDWSKTAIKRWEWALAWEMGNGDGNGVFIYVLDFSTLKFFPSRFGFNFSFKILYVLFDVFLSGGTFVFNYSKVLKALVLWVYLG